MVMMAEQQSSQEGGLPQPNLLTLQVMNSSTGCMRMFYVLEGRCSDMDALFS